MATDARLSQLPVEVLKTGLPVPPLRLSQLPLEVLRRPSTPEVVMTERVQTFVVLPC